MRNMLRILAPSGDRAYDPTTTDKLYSRYQPSGWTCVDAEPTSRLSAPEPRRPVLKVVRPRRPAVMAECDPERRFAPDN
jgi:hypothetical protein